MQQRRLNNLLINHTRWLLAWALTLAACLCDSSAQASPQSAAWSHLQLQAAARASQPAGMARTLGDWQNGNVNGVVNAIAVAPNGDVYIGGSFTMAGTTAVANVAKWNGTAWSTLGAGLSYFVNALAVDSNGNLFAGGSVPNGSTMVQHLDKWNGVTWSPAGTGINGTVYALAADQAGNVYVGGSFSVAGGSVGNGIAKWNGTAWSALGSGFGAAVYALALDNAGNLYAGGGSYSGYVSKWNGTSCSTLGNWLAGVVTSLATDGNGNVYAGHYPPNTGTSPTAGLAKWNGTSWQQVGSGGVPMALALVVDGNNALYMGSSFSSIGGVAAYDVAKWNSTAWSAVGNGMSNQYSARVNALALRGNMLYAGGGFSTSGDGTRPIVNFGIYDLAAPLATVAAALARQVQLYPNPTRNTATVEVPASLSRQPMVATLLDATGRQARTFALPAQGTTSHILDLHNLPAGMYTLQLATSEGTISRQLVVEQ